MAFSSLIPAQGSGCFSCRTTPSSPPSLDSSLHPSLRAPLVPDQAARVVVTWLNKAKEAEEKRTRAAAEPLALDGGGDSDEMSEEDDEDQDEFVYDIQVQ